MPRAKSTLTVIELLYTILNVHTVNYTVNYPIDAWQ